MSAPEERISTSLYELTDSLEQLIHQHVDEHGVLDDAFEAELLRLEGDWESKCINVALFAKGLATEGDAAKGAAQAIEAQAKQRRVWAETLYAQAERMLRYLDSQLQRREVGELKDPRARIHYRASSGVEIDRPDLVPAKYRKAPPKWDEMEPSKTLLKDAMKKANKGALSIGIPVPGSNGEKTKVQIAHVYHRRTLKVS